VTDKREGSSEQHTRELEAIKQENLLLKEELQLQRTSWLYAHHLSLSILLGVAIGVLVALLSYVGMGSLRIVASFDILRNEYLIGSLILFVLLGIPLIAAPLLILVLKAPSFSYASLRTYLVSFFFFETLMTYVDPLHIWVVSNQEPIDRIGMAFGLSLTQSLVIALFVMATPQIAGKCGYRQVLDGSALSFEVDTDITNVSKQLNELEEDFNLAFDKPSSKPDKLYFTKTHDNKETVLQFFLRPKEKKTDVILVMHSIRNDIPMRSRRDEVERIGKSLMKWLEFSNHFSVRETQNEQLVKEIVQESKKSFYRQPVALPSKKVVGGFLRAHWKDFLIILSVVVAVLSWLLPQR